MITYGINKDETSSRDVRSFLALCLINQQVYFEFREAFYSQNIEIPLLGP
jgi:hypothetical protein